MLPIQGARPMHTTYTMSDFDLARKEGARHIVLALNYREFIGSLDTTPTLHATLLKRR